MHEHWPEFSLIDMNGRFYDPLVARFLSPDPYVQAPDNSQNFNRYSYCLNNPLKYTDPSGEMAWFVPVIIGAAIGSYVGGTLANDSYNPLKWDYGSGKTWRYIGFGGLVGAASGYLGAEIAASGCAFANTTAITMSSFVNSVGTAAYTNGQTDVNISFGVASFNMTKRKFGFLGKKGNKRIENFGYALGTLANVSDVLIGVNPQKVDLVTEHSDGIGHSALVEADSETAVVDKYHNFIKDPNSIISVGPDRINDENGSWHWMHGTNGWNTHSRQGELIWRNTIQVNRGTINRYVSFLNTRIATGNFHYSVELSSCVSHVSRALNLSGVFNIGIHPYLLCAQMSLWSSGVRPWSVCNYLK